MPTPKLKIGSGLHRARRNRSRGPRISRAPLLPPATPHHKGKLLDCTNATPLQIDLAFATCRAVKFAGEDSRRHHNWDLNSLLSAERLALAALGEGPVP